MNIIILLLPFSLFLALLGLGAFWWTFRNGQYDDPAGDAARVLYDHLDDLTPPPSEYPSPLVGEGIRSPHRRPVRTP